MSDNLPENDKPRFVELPSPFALEPGRSPRLTSRSDTACAGGLCSAVSVTRDSRHGHVRRLMAFLLSTVHTHLID